ncbi:MAG: hypothetical protein GY750_02990 [Lentisphaerae bacterium]|nr:hypothetical protein [Lentisphaerota bacterium]
MKKRQKKKNQMKLDKPKRPTIIQVYYQTRLPELSSGIGKLSENAQKGTLKKNIKELPKEFQKEEKKKKSLLSNKEKK